MTIKTITVTELQKMIENKNEVQLLDVREEGEEPFIDELRDLHLPLGEVCKHAQLIAKNKKVIIFCKGGTRSKRAIELLEKEFAFTNLYNLEGGVMEWIKHYQLK